MTIANLMTREVVQISPDLPLTHAAEMMEQQNTNCLLVFENDRHIGIITTRDIVQAIANGVNTALPVSSLIMTAPVTIAQTANKVDAYLSLVKHGIRHLLVLDSAGHAAGIISESDFCQPNKIERLMLLDNAGNAMSSSESPPND